MEDITWLWILLGFFFGRMTALEDNNEKKK